MVGQNYIRPEVAKKYENYEYAFDGQDAVFVEITVVEGFQIPLGRNKEQNHKQDIQEDQGTSPLAVIIWNRRVYYSDSENF